MSNTWAEEAYQAFLKELSDVCHKYQFGITGESILVFDMEPDDDTREFREVENGRIEFI